ncbi:MAG: hypothetical protein K6F27_09730 [Ruminococcus sp.]|nr:hypothetical protein [Ruminococcus sp.]
MKFKVDQLPAATDVCPFENICPKYETSDCPKNWKDGAENDPTERASLRECEFLVEVG